MSYRILSTATVLGIAAMFNVTNISAQECRNGKCRLPSYQAPSADTFSIPDDGTRNIPRYTGYSGQAQASQSAVTCRDSRCDLYSACRNCGCDDIGEKCNCGPNCPPHGPSARNDHIRPELQAPRPAVDYRDSAVQLRRPSPDHHRPVTYNRSINWESSIRAAADRSRATGRPMLVQVTASWCGYCQRMKRETYMHQSLIGGVNRDFVALSVDADANREFVQNMKIESLPTTLIVLPSLQVVERLDGFQSATQLQNALSRHLQRAQLDTSAHVAIR